jgi:hypothetical protein
LVRLYQVAYFWVVLAHSIRPFQTATVAKHFIAMSKEYSKVTSIEEFSDMIAVLNSQSAIVALMKVSGKT